MLFRRFVFILFFGSGISGLVYQVVWVRMFSRVLGSTTYAVSTVLAAFMGGLALGSFVFGKYIDRRDDGLRVYGLMEMAIGLTAFIVPSLIPSFTPILRYVYQASESLGKAAAVGILLSFFLLLIPTILMGGTLPVLVSFLTKRNSLFGHNMSLLYGLNTLGAVVGTVASGFFLIGSIGEQRTIMAGILINIAVGVLAITAWKTMEAPGKEGVTGGNQDAGAPETVSPYPEASRRFVLAASFFSGFTALAYEVIWTRQLLLMLGTSIYSFSTMLATFLTGIGIGSLIAKACMRKFRERMMLFGILEMSLGFVSLTSLQLFLLFGSSVHMIFLSTPLSGLNNIIAGAAIIFPLALLFGVIFPIAASCYTRSTREAGSSVGSLYSFNTIGCILGSTMCGFLLIPTIGSARSMTLLGLINVILGIILIWMELPDLTTRKSKWVALAFPVLFVLLASGTGDPFLTAIEERVRQWSRGNYEIFLNKEWVEATTTAFTIWNKMRDRMEKKLWINGVGMTALSTETKLMAHLPILLSKDPRDILVVCFGMGTTMKSASAYGRFSITSVELVPEVYECFGYFHPNADDIVKRNRIGLITGDGRNYLLLTSRMYDVITVDPAPPVWSAGTVNLYTREFFLLCRQHLRPGGVMCLWFPTNLCDDMLSVLRTFRDVFPHTTLWKGMHGWGFYFAGSFSKQKIDRARIDSIFHDPDIHKDLSEYCEHCVTARQLLDLFIAEDDGIDRMTGDAPIVTDDYPYTEFPLWRHFLKRGGEPKEHGTK